MQISKAVITAAGPDQRSLPLQTLVDRDGRQKTALEILVEDARSAGVDQICVVVHRGDADAYAKVAGDSARRLQFVEQDGPLGYGHALYCAKAFVGEEPFLHMVADHLWVSSIATGCAAQLVAAARESDCAVSAVQSTREAVLPLYGAVGGRPVEGRTGLYQVDTVREKPTPTQAEQELIVPGLRTGHYLCFFGMHVLTPACMALLKEDLDRPGGGRVDLSAALGRLAQRERYLALDIAGKRYNIGVRYGLFLAQLALILDGEDREEVLAQMVELLATRSGPGPSASSASSPP